MNQATKTSCHGGIATSSVDGKTVEQIRGIIEATIGQAGAPIRVLQKVQGLIGYLPREVLDIISKEMRIPPSELYGITSFYSFFSMVPKGKYVIRVCLGTSCYVKGGQGILGTLKRDFGLEAGVITADGRFSLETVGCLGCCGLAPVMAIGDDVHGKVELSKLGDILDSYR